MEKSKKITLQVGESTHSHILESQKDIQHEQVGDGGIHFILEGQGILKHEEHGPMAFKAGNYFKFPQMEFDPLANNIRQVFD